MCLFTGTMNDQWVHEVIEGRDSIIRRILRKKDPHVLATKHTTGVSVARIEYNQSQQLIPVNYDNHDEENDRGFISYYDEFHDRMIFVASGVVGSSQIFHEENAIQYVWNVINPCTNHEHSTYMSNSMKEWFVTNMMQVCLEMLDTEGNIALFCKGGRTRSPMYLIAYLVLFCNMPFEVAHQNIGKIMQQSRHQVLDRHYSLHEIIATLVDVTKHSL